MTIMYYKRLCPGCNKELSYKSPVSFKFAEKNAQKCVKCCKRKNSVPQEIQIQILELNTRGVLNREIARTLNLHHKTVAFYLNKYNKESVFANQPIDMVSEKEACCRKCGGIKSIDEFQFGRKGQKYEYRFSYCNKCRKQQVYLNLNGDVNKFLADRFSRLKRRAIKENIPFDLTREEFIGQYHKQQGLCFYTNTPLVCEVGSELHRNSLSVDKLEPSSGYITGNVVLASNKINTCKNDLPLKEVSEYMPGWHAKIMEFQMRNNQDLVWREERLTKVINTAKEELSTSNQTIKGLSDPLTDEEMNRVQDIFTNHHVEQGNFGGSRWMLFVQKPKNK